METGTAADSTFEYVIFRILPENRYEACIFSGEKAERVGHGPLDQLLEHVPSIKDQIAQGSLDNFKLKLPNTNDHKRFTKAILMRYLSIIGSSDLSKAIEINNEMSQLEEARKFHLSLYSQVDKGVKSSDTSKNELLQAMNSRLEALTEELASAVNLSAGATLSLCEMIDLQNCCEHFGDVKTRNLISNLSEKNLKIQIEDSSDKPKPYIPFIPKNDYASKSAGNPQVSNPVIAAKYNASPAKAAEMERHSSTESDTSSSSSGNDQSPAERSRTLARSASPRRSASPMRKVQIGKSGSRRTPALAIRSLPYFPPRERISHKDSGNDSDSEVDEEPIKKTEVNVTRISVQDAISLFERKQKDDIVDSQKKSVNDNSVNLNKVVLRRWSSGMGEAQKSSWNTPADRTLENNVNSVEEDTLRRAEGKPDTMEDKIKSKEDFELKSNLDLDAVQGCQTDETGEKIDSVEWSRQKEAELNQMLMKFAQYNLSNPKNTEPDSIKNHGSRLPQKGRINAVSNEGKAGRNEKPKVEKTGKKLEKQADVLRSKKKVVEMPKVEKASGKAAPSRTSIVNSSSRIPNVVKNVPLSLNSKKESPKPDALKRASSKPSSLGATRKSWPSTPSPRTLETNSSKISTGPPSGILASRQKFQPPVSGQKPPSLASRQKVSSLASSQKPQSPIVRSSPKLHKTLLQQKDVKEPQVETKKYLRKVEDSKSRALSKTGTLTKTKTATSLEEAAAVSPVKAVARKKGTKKSSVVPLEPKAPSRKVSGSIPVINLLKKTELSVQADQTLIKCENLVCSPAKRDGTSIPDIVHPLESIQAFEAPNDDLELKSELERENINNEIEKTNSAQANVKDNDPTERLLDSPGVIHEPVISPAAWEESDGQDPTFPIGNVLLPNPVNPDVLASSGTRVRHSLSQMLLEESSDPDIIEWGNAENPPAMIYQKDAPKGFKRLLKFTRKNKGETNGSTWASPYTSEGEDDGDEYRSIGKRNSDNLLKVALHSKNHGEGFLSDSEPLSARSNTSNNSARSSSKFQDGHITKGTRSFFSLSAFRGNKS